MPSTETGTHDDQVWGAYSPEDFRKAAEVVLEKLKAYRSAVEMARAKAEQAHKEMNPRLIGDSEGQQ